MPSSIPTLIEAIKQYITKAEAAVKKSEQHWLSAGLRLKELKARKPKDITWAVYVRNAVGLSQQRADELIRIADGRQTVEETRAGRRNGMREARSGAASTPRGVDQGQPPHRIDQFVNANDEVKSACDFNGEDPADIAEPGDSDEVIRQRKFTYHASEAIRHARNNGLEEAADEEITSEMILLAKRAAAEWSAVASSLTQRQTKQGASHEKEAIRPAVH